MKNIRAYIVGNVRYFLYYKIPRLMRFYIKDQVEWRIEIMNSKCYENGSCVQCGCRTTHLQMANKSCDKPCYPPIMSFSKWKDFIKGQKVEIKGVGWEYTITEVKGVVRHKIYKNGELAHIKQINKNNG